MRSRRVPPGDNPRSADPAACREAALRLLERTRRTRSDLARRLGDRGYAASTIEQVLDRLAEVGLVNDVEYARAFLAGRRNRRAAGRRRLEMELRGKGVSAEDIAAGSARLDEEQGAFDEVAAARQVVLQAERRVHGLEPWERRRRLYALLARRGFDPDTIAAALGPHASPED
jgi:regulatory protein